MVKVQFRVVYVQKKLVTETAGRYESVRDINWVDILGVRKTGKGRRP